MNFGFTGTQDGLTDIQLETLCNVLQALQNDRGLTEFHHGDCVGADETAHRLVRDINAGCAIHVHPPDNPKKRAYCEGGVLHEERPYLERNHDIVDACDVLIACPQTIEEQLRSGTWATVRYARKIGKRVIMVSPLGGFDIGGS